MIRTLFCKNQFIQILGYTHVRRPTNYYIIFIINRLPRGIDHPESIFHYFRQKNNHPPVNLYYIHYPHRIIFYIRNIRYSNKTIRTHAKGFNLIYLPICRRKLCPDQKVLADLPNPRTPRRQRIVSRLASATF